MQTVEGNETFDIKYSDGLDEYTISVQAGKHFISNENQKKISSPLLSMELSRNNMQYI